MIISIKDGEKVITGGVWLIMPEDLTGLPVGLRYAVMAEGQPYWSGMSAIIVNTVDNLFEYGAINCDNKYPNGVPIYEVENIINWITVVEQVPVDPLPETTDEKVYASALFRNIIPKGMTLKELKTANAVNP